MKRLDQFRLAAALLAGSALVSPVALAQEDTGTTKPPIIEGQGQGQGSAETKPSASGQAQPKKSQAATEAGPEEQRSGQSKAASEAAPGQVKPSSEGQAVTDAPKEPQASGAAEAPKEAKPSGAAEAGGSEQPEQPPKATTETEPEAAPGQADQEQATESKPSQETTASVDISSEQKVEIREVIREVNVQPIDVDFEVNVGVAVPRTVELRPLPPRIVEIVPAYRDYEFFVLADGRIVIVEPDTLEIVYVLVV